MPAVNPTEKLNWKKYFSLEHKHLAPGNRVAGKKGAYQAVFERVEGKLLCLIFNLEAGLQTFIYFSLGR
jgi:hypothetical protein